MKGEESKMSKDKVRFSLAQYAELKRLFSPRDITDSSTLESIMYDAGQKRVLDHVRRNTDSPKEHIIRVDHAD